MLISEQLNQSRQPVQQQQVSFDSIKFIDHLPLIFFFSIQAKESSKHILILYFLTNFNKIHWILIKVDHFSSTYLLTSIDLFISFLKI